MVGRWQGGQDRGWYVFACRSIPKVTYYLYFLYYYYVYKIHLRLFILLNILISDRVPLLCNIFLIRPVSNFSPLSRDLNTIQYFWIQYQYCIQIPGKLTEFWNWLGKKYIIITRILCLNLICLIHFYLYNTYWICAVWKMMKHNYMTFSDLRFFRWHFHNTSGLQRGSHALSAGSAYLMGAPGQ